MNTVDTNDSRSQQLANRFALWLVVGATLLAPWLFAAADAWSHLFIVILTFAAGCLALIALLLGPRHATPIPCLVPLTLLIAYVGTQSLDLGPSLSAWLSPSADSIRRESVDILSEVQQLRARSAILDTPAAAISLSPAATRRSFILLTGYFIVFMVMAGSINHWHEVRAVSAVLLISTFLLALLSILHHFSDSTTMMWFHKPRHGGTFFGTFTNRNHAGAHFNMMFGLSAAMLLSAVTIHGAESLSLRERLLAFSTRHTSRIILMAFATMVIGATVILSRSRGAAVSLLAALACFAAVQYRFGSGERRTRSVTFLSLILLVAAVWIGWTPLMSRLATLSNVIIMTPVEPDSRMVATGSTLQIFGLCPLTGSGFGSFRHVFPIFQPSSITFGRWNHAHNDWAQLLAEGGIIGALLFLLLLLGWLRWLKGRWPMMLHRAQIFIQTLSIGLIAIAMHSFFDYGLHKPANAWTLAALAGLVTAAARINARSETPPPIPSCPAPPPLPGWVRQPFLAVVLIGLTLLASFTARQLQAELEVARFLYFARSIKETAPAQPMPGEVITESLASANFIHRLGIDDPDACRDISSMLFTWAIDPSVPRILRADLTDAAARIAGQGVFMAPSDYLCWIWLARSLALGGQWEAAELCLGRARQLCRVPVMMFGTNPHRQP